MLAVVPVTVLVVGATMIVVGSHEAEESVKVAVGKRLVPKVSDVVEVEVGRTTVVSEDVDVGKGCEVDGVEEGKSVSEAVLLGGSVTVLAKLVVKVPVGRSESVELAEMVGRISLPVALVVGVMDSVLFGGWVTSVADAVEEPAMELLVKDPVWAAEPVAESPPEALLIPTDETPEGPLDTPLAVAVAALPDPVIPDTTLLRMELRESTDVGVAEDPVPGPVGVPIVAKDSLPVLVGLVVSVTPETTLLKIELKMFVGETVEEPVPGPVGVPIMVAESVASLVALDVSVTAETTLLKMELRMSEVAEAVVPVPGPVGVPITVDESVESLVGLDVSVTAETTLLKMELRILVSEEVVVAAVLAPVPGPVTPEVTEASAVALAVASEVGVTIVELPLSVVDAASTVVASLVDSAVEASVVAVLSSVLVVSLLAVVVACEVTPVPAPVAVESIVLVVTAGAKSLVTPETMLLTPETRLLIKSAVVEAVVEAASVEASLLVVAVESAVVALSVEETIIPLDVSDTAVLSALVVVVDGVTMP